VLLTKQQRLTENQKLRVQFKLPALALLGALVLSASRPAQANTGKTFLETIGVSTAVGTVLGASTLPFYDQPGTHLQNLAYGAGAGFVIGAGIGLYRILSGQAKRDAFGQDREEPDTVLSQTIASESRLDRVSGNLVFSPARPNQPAAIWSPLVSLTW
jgi:hypothetical protein